uniref:Uncharacterized protein n=1 Tax=Anolis carolinensis TaxID=28377 RepID=G1KG23_ANOCA
LGLLLSNRKEDQKATALHKKRLFFYPCLKEIEPYLYSQIRNYVSDVNVKIGDARRQLIGYLLEKDKGWTQTDKDLQQEKKDSPRQSLVKPQKLVRVKHKSKQVSATVKSIDPGLKSPNVFDSVAKALVDVLIEGGAKIDPVTKELHTPLHLASYKGHTEVAQKLLQNKAKVNLKDKQSKTPLHLGAEKGHIALVELLLGSNADPNSADKEKKTPLHLASIGSHLSTIKALLAKKSRFGAKDMDGCIPAHYAAISGNMEILKALLVAGNYKNINDKNIWRKTPLHLTAEYGHSDMMHYLLSNGSAINALDNNKDTPLHCPAQMKRNISEMC